MLETVNVAPGKFMLIAELQDDQLVFHTKRRIAILAELRKMGTGKRDELVAAMYNRPSVTPAEAGRLMRIQIQDLYPLLAELYLREMHDPTLIGDLQEALGRAEALPRVDRHLFLDLISEDPENAEGKVWSVDAPQTS